MTVRSRTEVSGGITEVNGEANLVFLRLTPFPPPLTSVIPVSPVSKSHVVF